MGNVASSGSAENGCDAAAEPGLRALSSFRGGVGACSVGSGSDGVTESPPNGPRGSNESSPTSSRVAWTTLRAGAFLGAGFPDGAFEGAAEGAASLSHQPSSQYRNISGFHIPGDVFSFAALGDASRMLFDFEGTSVLVLGKGLRMRRESYRPMGSPGCPLYLGINRVFRTVRSVIVKCKCEVASQCRRLRVLEVADFPSNGRRNAR
jgi:hypothetical protein